jgi:CheY-like chemotaxis protein/anti-sigma regulatory factor (Ser/Thr protein kinase)
MLHVRSDAVLLERIVRNLITNALRYTPAGRVLVAARRRGRSVVLQVWDTGIGIPSQERERIFEEFYQTGNPERNSRKGLGLGLSIVRRLAQLLDAPVALRSRPGRGSCFSVTLPLGTVPSAEEAAPPPGIAVPGFAGACIALVEDEDEVLQGMSLLLESWGARVVAAECSEALQARLAGEHRAPDLIIADYRLRDGATGTDAIRAVRARYRSAVPAIVVTASTLPEHLGEARSLDAHVLTKPVMPAKLRALISFKLQEAA